MKILVSGSSGFVGAALVESLRADGHTVVKLLRGNRPLGTGDARWDPIARTLDLPAVEGADALVNLAGASIGDKRWST
ncbi:MAG: NAD-dependent epimerase/dehydratase family protein, partial [Candidatus Acidiferrales bacterium]